MTDFAKQNKPIQFYGMNFNIEVILFAINQKGKLFEDNRKSFHQVTVTSISDNSYKEVYEVDSSLDLEHELNKIEYILEKHLDHLYKKEEPSKSEEEILLEKIGYK